MSYRSILVKREIHPTTGDVGYREIDSLYAQAFPDSIRVFEFNFDGTVSSRSAPEWDENGNDAPFRIFHYDWEFQTVGR